MTHKKRTPQRTVLQSPKKHLHIVAQAIIWGILSVFPLSLAASEKVDISGRWQFALDPDNRGLLEQWMAQDLPLSATLPGSVVTNGYGDAITTETKFRGHIYHEWYTSDRYEPYRQPGNIKIVSFLTPDKHYVGKAWFSRMIEIPERWQGKETFVFLERCNFVTTLWLEGTQVGTQDSLSTPHLYTLGILNPGTYRLTLCVDNDPPINVGVSHALNDWIQTQWNGIIGRLELYAKDRVFVSDVQAYPELKDKRVQLKVTMDNPSGAVQPCRVTLTAAAYNGRREHRPAAKTFSRTLSAAREVLEFVYEMGDDVLLWDEFEPNLYQLTVLIEGKEFVDERTLSFGMRNVEIDGKRFTVNGRPVMLRGTTEDGVAPLTGYTPISLDDWRRIFRLYKDFGLNHMRFHSWCPPEAAFTAADEVGFYLQPEGPFNGQIGDGQAVDDYLVAETTRILNTYGNHPCFVMFAHGNEPLGDKKDSLLVDQVNRWKSLDKRHKYVAGSGWPVLAVNDFNSSHYPRLQLWGEGLMSSINAVRPGTTRTFDAVYDRYDRPAVVHEPGQWCVYPNFAEIKKYTGVLKAGNYEIFRDFLNQNAMGDQAEAFLMASGKLQTLCYKEEIETALRTQDCAGFQILSLHDYPGQGSALVGVIDSFRDPKPYITANQFRRFCNSTVPLAKFEKFVWTTEERFEAEVVVSHFGRAAIEGAAVSWHLSDTQGRIRERGRWENTLIPVGSNQPVGHIRLACGALPAPARYTLTVAIEGTDFYNEWNLWVYPSTVETEVPADILLTQSLDTPAREFLQNGGSVLLMPDAKAIETPCKIGFGSMFWNVSFTNYQAPHTVGLLCDPHHPVFREFPTEYHSDWQWWDLVKNSAAIIINDFPPSLRPLIQPIDNYFDARRLSLLYEARVDGGRLMVCTIDLANDLDKRPAARQLRRSLLRYMQSSDFSPAVSITADLVTGSLSVSETASIVRDIGATILSVSAQTDEAPAKNMLDGKKNTLWLSNPQHAARRFPHSVVIDLKQPRTMAGLRYVPRQDTPGGRVGRYRIYISDDPQTRGEPVARGQWPDTAEEQKVPFPEPVRGRYVTVEAVDEVHGWSYITIADIDIILDWRN